MTFALPSRRPLLSPAWAINDLWRRARAKPSLDLNFAQTKSLTDTISGQSLITFTRASSATYVGSDGLIKTAAINEPRFDHNPTTGESLGLLVEEQRTNLLLQSNGFDTTWTNTNSTESAAQGTAPDGTNTAWAIIDSVDASPTTHSLLQIASGTSGVTYTYSVWAKAGTLPELILLWPSAIFGATTTTRFNLSNGTIVTAGVGTTNSIIAFPNGWYRLVSTLTATATASGAFQLRLGNGTGATYQGNGTGTILIWGAQLEAGAFPTSYIPTTTATVTRSADVASISGSNFSSWYRQTEGTVFADVSIPAVSLTALSFSDGTANERILMDTGTNTRRLIVTDGGSAQASVTRPYTYGTRTKTAVAATENSFMLCEAGVLGTEDTAGTMPTVDRLNIGANATGSAILNSHLSRLTYWPQRLSNSTLQAVTQ